MTKQELIEKVENGRDIMFDVAGKHYTILTWPEEGILIAEQHTEKNKAAFVDAKSLVSDYLVDGVPLGDLVGEIRITDYT